MQRIAKYLFVNINFEFCNFTGKRFAKLIEFILKEDVVGTVVLRSSCCFQRGDRLFTREKDVNLLVHY